MPQRLVKESRFSATDFVCFNSRVSQELVYWVAENGEIPQGTECTADGIQEVFVGVNRRFLGLFDCGRYELMKTQQYGTANTGVGDFWFSVPRGVRRDEKVNKFHVYYYLSAAKVRKCVYTTEESIDGAFDTAEHTVSLSPGAFALDVADADSYSHNEHYKYTLSKLQKLTFFDENGKVFVTVAYS